VTHETERRRAYPDVMIPFFESKARYNIAYGGRGSSKSWTFSDILVWRAYSEKLFIPCLRQFQVSIKDSVHKLLSGSIEKLGLEPFFDVQEKKIVSDVGSEFIFKGLARNLNNLKSLEGADHCWVTEAQDVTSKAWEKLIPTIRKTGSQFWIDFNPEEEEDPTYQRFVINTPKNSIKTFVNYYDNPFFPDTLEEERLYDQEYNQDEYNNIWLGECKKVTAAQIMRNKWEIKEFEAPDDAVFYYGSDWGNTGTGDPDAIVRFFEKDGYLYIDYEAVDHVQKIEDYIPFYNSMPGSNKWRICCDNTMAKFRKYINGYGYNLFDATKGPGSVEAGIKFLRSFKKIFIHPRCKTTIFEFKNYKYKVDAKTGEILNIIVDKHNHIIDSLRYAAERLGKTARIIRY
jgi:phage terminase large subunit